MTSADACARWASLADRIAVGDEIALADAAFMRRHAAGCDACAREARLYMDLEALLEPERAPAERERGEEHGEREPRASAMGSTRRIRGAVIAAAALAAAAAVVVYARDRGPSASNASPSAPSVAPALPALPAATVTLLEGDATVNAVSASAGALLASGATIATGVGRACVRVDPGVRVCLGAATRVRIENLSGPARVLRLERGRVVAELDPQPPGSTFSIAASDGMVTAIGTAFSVELTDGAPAVARVSHGAVLVRAPNAERTLHAHETARFGEAARALPAAEEDSDRALLREAIAHDAKTPARVTLDSSPGGAVVRVDGAPVGATPLDLLVAPGAHVITVDGADAPLAVQVREGEHVAKAWLLAASAPGGRETARGAVLSAQAPSARIDAPPARSAPPPVAPPASASADDGPAPLLAAAQSARARGDAAAAARAYRALLAAHPQSAEASAATISLAEIELARGADAEALPLFDRYLAGGGPLALEARFGRIRALEHLGRADDARDAIASFLRDYPGSPQADALRAHAGAP